MIYPKKLKNGGTIGLVCTSSPISEDRLNQCMEKLNSMGYKVKTADNITENYGGYMAGTGLERGMWINKMFADIEVDAIFCVRGGDSSSRCCEYIDLDVVKKNPKIFVGYSDVTNMHMLFNRYADLVTFHGPMVSSNMVDDFDEDSCKALFEAINGDEKYELRNPDGIPFGIMKDGVVKGPVTGGNLSLVSAAMGTPYEMDSKGKIIFLEEVDEPVTKIEKWCYQLRNAGKFKDCIGVILGQFTGITNKYMPEYTVLDCITDILHDINVPVMYDIQSGHGNKMITVPLGAECAMNTEKKSIIFDIKR